MTLLQRIQQLQFTDPAEAERLLLGFINETFPLQATTCELRPQAISLNSFNGFITLEDGTRKFFKTHTESDNIIDEYYNAQLLIEHDYPVILPTHSSHRAGQHLLIYDVVEDPSVFDLAWQIENDGAEHLLEPLARAQTQADRDLYDIYTATLDQQSADGAEAAPIHQLFYHRLVGGRFKRFYGPLEGDQDAIPQVDLPGGAYSMRDVRMSQWSINGQLYDETLNQIAERAIHMLRPHQTGPSVVGHGDAHNGNVFFQPAAESLLYFDPAFAGRHNPLLDLVKPIFHNVFAMWLYFPAIMRDRLNIRIRRDPQRWMVTYDYPLPPVRELFLRSKVEHVLVPLVQMLKARGQLRADWRTYFKCALFCCPFLTMNLADNDRFPPEISLLGFVMAMEMGAESVNNRSVIDTVLDGVERAL
jgi:hypothetical protein